MKRNRLEKLGDFVLGKGFYIVLFLCVAAIGISGYYLIRSVSGSEPAQEPVTANPSVTLPDSSAVFPGEQSHQPQPTPEPAAQPDDPQPKKDAETAAPAQPREVVYTWPVKGQVLRGFTVEALAYDETMGDWRTHGSASPPWPMTRPWGTGGPMGGSTSPPRRAGRCWRPERARWLRCMTTP